MIRFHQTFGAHTGRIYEFDKDVVTFGRLPECDVSFDPQADIDASGRHAEARRDGNGFVIVDTGSRNGTWLNGQRVERALLSTGDELEFGMGGPRLRVELVGAESGARVTGPMTPAPASQRTAAATPIGSDPSVHGIDTTAPTMMAPATPTPPVGQPAARAGGGGNWQTPIEMSQPSAPLGGWPTPVPETKRPPAPHPGAEPPKHYGQKTVGMMIQAAVAEARQQSDQGKSRSTAFIKAIASEAAHSSSRGLKIAVAVLAILLVIALGGLVVLLIVNRMEADEARLRDRQLQQQVAQGPAGARIAAAYNGAIYLLVERGPTGVENGLCTAFAVRPDLLATNAHCVVAMERRQGTGATYFALPNGGRGEHLAISSMWRHPGYQPEGEHPSADVGLVQIQGSAPVQVTLAPLGRVQQLGPGDEIYVYGFPGDLVNVSSPVATITNGVIGRTVAFDGTGADVQNAQLIQHSAFTSPGTSGSPIFDRDGQVIAVNAGTFRSAQQQQVMGPLGPEAQTVVTESGYKYGVRADLLASLLAGLGR